MTVWRLSSSAVLGHFGGAGVEHRHRDGNFVKVIVLMIEEPAIWGGIFRVLEHVVSHGRKFAYGMGPEVHRFSQKCLGGRPPVLL